MRSRVAFPLLLALVSGSCSSTTPRTPTKEDAIGLERLLKDSTWVVTVLKKNKEKFARSSTVPLSADERAMLMPVWAGIIDHDLAFESFKKQFMRFGSRLKDQSDRDRALILGYTAFVAQLREFFSLLGVMNDREVFAVAFNESAAEYGISAGHYERMLRRTASPETFLTFQIVSERFAKRLLALKEQANPDDDLLLEISGKVSAWSDDIENSLNQYGTKLMARVAVKTARNEVDQIIAPIQADVALWLGDTRVRASGRSLISKEDLDTLLPMLEPGDIFIERRNWYLSNLGLPGFWPHAAFFVGSPDELVSFFDSDADVLAVFPDGLSKYLEVTYSEVWQQYAQADEEGEDHRVIEAISEGVVFTSLYHSALADYVGVLRPRRSKLDRAWAIVHSFSHHGKPYDFDFSFLSQAALVCSELVWASYQLTSQEGEGLDLHTSKVFGRVTLPPTDIVKQFDEEYDSPNQQMDFVGFLDGNEATNSATFESLEVFRESWKRPKWDLSQE
jgi:hypothetical protein